VKSVEIDEAQIPQGPNLENQGKKSGVLRFDMSFHQFRDIVKQAYPKDFSNDTKGNIGEISHSLSSKSYREKHDLRYLLALLNSRLLGWYFPFVSAPFRGGWMSANKQFLSQLPFRTIDFSNPADKALHDKTISLAEQMLGAKQQLTTAQTDKDKDFYTNKCEAIGQGINALVYELYGLTPEEIQIVESEGN